MRTFTYWFQSNRWNDEVTKFLFHPDRAWNQIPTHGNQNGISAENIWGSNNFGAGFLFLQVEMEGTDMKLSHECISPNVYQDPHHTSCPNHQSFISTPTPKKMLKHVKPSIFFFWNKISAKALVPCFQLAPSPIHFLQKPYNCYGPRDLNHWT